jgi:hypothetical protein
MSVERQKVTSVDEFLKVSRQAVEDGQVWMHVRDQQGARFVLLEIEE